MTTPIPSIALILIGLVALVIPALAWFLLRGRPHRIKPACPLCQYCLTGTSGSTCPECGNDLNKTGVYLHGRRRIARGYRVLIFIPIAVLLMPIYAGETDAFWTRQAANIFGNTIERTGFNEVQYELFPEKSDYSRIRTIFPDPIMLPPSVIQGPVTTWLPPQPVRLIMTLDDGTTRDYRIRSVSEDHSKWMIQRISPLAGSTGNNFKSGQPLEASTDDLAAAIASRIRQDEPPEAGEDRGPLLAAAIATKLVKVMMEWEPPLETTGNNTFVSDAGFADLRMRSMYHNAAGQLPVQRVGPYWLIVSSWVIGWLILLTIVAIPGTPTDPWEPEETSPTG